MIPHDDQQKNEPIGVMIVEDSPTIRIFLEQTISQNSRLRVVASVATGEQALDLLPTIQPDVISLDIRLPGINGFEVTRRVMSTRPTPIVVCSASVEGCDLQITMNALRAGALAVVEKPVGNMHGDFRQLSERLCNQLIVMSQVKVIRQWISPKGPAALQAMKPPLWVLPVGSRSCEMVGIVASTGGPNALTTVLNALPACFPLPILVVQHIAASFTDGFVDWLGTVCPFKVIKGEARAMPQPGCVYVAPADCDLVLRSGRIQITSHRSNSIHEASGTALLRSMAESLGSAAVGVVLTGMGDDGADGLLAIREAGGFTIAEDQSTAVVFGMPAAAVQRGAACEVLPLPSIGTRIWQVVQAGKEKCHDQASPHFAC